MSTSTLAWFESPRAAFTGAEAAERGEDHAHCPDMEGRIMRFRTTRRRTTGARRRCRSWSKKFPAVLFWGCYELAIRYVRRRGWRPVRLTRVGVVETVLWPASSEETADEAKDGIAGAYAGGRAEAPGGDGE